MPTAYDIEFQVIDTIDHKASWTHISELHSRGEGRRFILEPAYALIEDELVGAQAEITEPNGEQTLLSYDYLHVGANNVLSLFFCSPQVPDIPRLSKLRFVRRGQA
jgi:hypothetical protein